MTALRRVLVGALVTGVVAIAGGASTYSALTSTTSNGGNIARAGTVVIADDGGGSSMWSLSGLLPGGGVTRCIRVTYTGTLAATVRLYSTSTPSGLDPYLDAVIDKGTMPSTTSFPSCTGFASEATIYSGTVDSFETTKTSFASGVSASPGSASQWANGDSVVYRFALTLQSTYAAQGLSSSLPLTWEAQNR